MNQKELFTLFPPACMLADRVLLIPPSEFWKLEGRSIDNCRIFLLVCKGNLKLFINETEHEMQACSFLDLLDGMTVRIQSASPDLSAYCLLPQYEFVSESLKNLRPGPDNYFLERIYFPILQLTEEEKDVLEEQMKLLAANLGKPDHYYRQELALVYFKSFMLEGGNIMFTHSKEMDEKNYNISKQEMTLLNFMKLVWVNFKTEHNIEFYADKLCISPKHLSRITKENLNKTPHEIIRDEIIHHAMSLLDDNNIPVQQISDMLGFSDQAAFSKFFKKHKQLSPMAYRLFRRGTSET